MLNKSTIQCYWVSVIISLFVKHAPRFHQWLIYKRNKGVAPWSSGQRKKIKYETKVRTYWNVDNDCREHDQNIFSEKARLVWTSFQVAEGLPNRLLIRPWWSSGQGCCFMIKKKYCYLLKVLLNAKWMVNYTKMVWIMLYLGGWVFELLYELFIAIFSFSSIDKNQIFF